MNDTAPRHKLTQLFIRWLIRNDMDEVLRIESESFEFPWSREDFMSCLRQRNCIGMVAMHKEEVVGFMIYELHKGRLNLLNLAVCPKHRRAGIGSSLILRLKDKLSQQRRREIEATVRETNMPALLLFQRLGFMAVEVIRGYYDDTSEDAIQMNYAIPLDDAM